MENRIEQHLKKSVEKMGGTALKILPAINAGWPDRLLLFPGAKIRFVETKDRGKKPRPLQRYIHRKLEKLGFEVAVIDTIEKVDNFLNEIHTV